MQELSMIKILPTLNKEKSLCLKQKMTDAVIVDKTEKSSQILGITMQCNNGKKQLKNV